MSLSAQRQCKRSDLVVQITELLHQVLRDPLAIVGLIMGHAVLGVQADASHTPLSISRVLQEPVVLRQVVHWVPIRPMDPSGSEFQSCFSCTKRESEIDVCCTYIRLKCMAEWSQVSVR